jgi:hypothetical protein
MFRLLLEALLWAAPDVAAQLVARASTRGEGHIPSASPKRGFDDPVYKGNLERLIEHHRQFEKKQ